MAVTYYINGVSFVTDGVYVSKSSGIIDGLKMRDPVKMTWPDHHGEVIDLAKPRYESREISLECFMKATSKSDFLSKAQTFIARFQLAGLQRLMITGVDATKPLVYEVYCIAAIEIAKKWNDSTMIGTFTLKLREPEPVKRVYSFVAAAGALSVTMAVTTTKPVNIYWGDASHTYDVVTASGTQTHAYAATGTYYIVITGVIEDITSVTTGATSVWTRL